MNHDARIARMFPTMAADAAAGDQIAKATLLLLTEAYAQGREDERLAQILNQKATPATAIADDGSDC